MDIPKQIEAWDVVTRDVPDRGLKIAHSADENERAVLASVGEVESVEEFVLKYTLKSARGQSSNQSSNQSYKLAGTISARITQACVLTLDPVTSEIEEDFACRFGTPPRDAVKPGEDKPILEVEDWEPFENGRLEIGRIVAETFVAAIDPFPRRDGAEFEWNDPRARKQGAKASDGDSDDATDQQDPDRPNPFAVLAKLKPKDTK